MDADTHRVEIAFSLYSNVNPGMLRAGGRAFVQALPPGSQALDIHSKDASSDGLRESPPRCRRMALAQALRDVARALELIAAEAAGWRTLAYAPRRGRVRGRVASEYCEPAGGAPGARSSGSASPSHPDNVSAQPIAVSPRAMTPLPGLWPTPLGIASQAAYGQTGLQQDQARGEAFGVQRQRTRLDLADEEADEAPRARRCRRGRSRQRIESFALT